MDLFRILSEAPRGPLYAARTMSLATLAGYAREVWHGTCRKVDLPLGIEWRDAPEGGVHLVNRVVSAEAFYFKPGSDYNRAHWGVDAE